MSPDLAHQIVLGLTWFVIFLFSTTLHEASHALAGYRLGDTTAHQGGQVTLNPWPHIRREPVGMILVPLITYAWRGWMMGWASAPYDPSWAHRYPRRAAVMALAGPAANLLLVLVAALLIRGGIALGTFYPPERISFTAITAATVAGSAAAAAVVPLSLLFSLNLILFVFNLLPLPPLDGSAVVPLLLIEQGAHRYQELLRQPMFSFIGLLVAWNLFDPVYRPLQTLALNLLYPGAGYH
jgi:Zn-dependent protease